MPYDDIIESAAKQFSLDPNLIRSFIQTESNWDPNATRFEAKLNDTSYGLMQVLLGTAKWVSGNPNLTSAQLLQPSVNILVGSKYIRYLADTWGGNIEDTIASYNAGDVYMTPAGDYTNQSYVNKVMGYYQSYRGPILVGGVGLLLLGGLAYFMYTRLKKK